MAANMYDDDLYGYLDDEPVVAVSCRKCVKHPGWAHDDNSKRLSRRDYCPNCLGSGVEQD